MHKGYILQFKDVAKDIRVLTIKLSSPYPYHAGQYAFFEIEGTDPRPFSIANAPRADNTIDIHVRDSGQNISSILCGEIRDSQSISVSDPYGKLKIQHTDKSKIFLAGGTGITPFLAMMQETSAPITLYWGMDNDHDFYVRPHHQGIVVHYCTDTYPIDAYLRSPIDNGEYYLSGPPAMVRDSLSKLLDLGVEHSNIYYDE